MALWTSRKKAVNTPGKNSTVNEGFQPKQAIFENEQGFPRS